MKWNISFLIKSTIDRVINAISVSKLRRKNCNERYSAGVQCVKEEEVENKIGKRG